MKFFSVCSGIEAASVAWNPLGWSAVGFSEIDPFPSDVLAYHYPETPNFGDLNGFREWPRTAVDVLVGGTPCQSFSVAGLGQGLADPRGNLALVYLACAERYRPGWLVWENVAGVLSTNEGRDFGAFVGALAELGYSAAWRVLYAQYFGVPQRRRRVFVVGYLGDWRRPAAVLFEPASLRGDPPPRRETGEESPREPDPRAPENCQGGEFIPDTCGTLSDGAHRGGGLNGQDVYTGRIIATHTVVDRSQITSPTNRSNPKPGDPCHSLSASAKPPLLIGGPRVRRLTPLECERLQGFPDGYTAIPGASDSARYKAVANSMPVPVIRWIGERIERYSA